jgi:hypothetical protein
VGKPPHRPACGTKLEPGKGAAHRDDTGVTAGVGTDIADASEKHKKHKIHAHALCFWCL